MLSSRFRNIALAAAIGLFYLAINRPVVGFDWVYFDDDINILLNPHLTGGGWETAQWAWTDLDYTRRYMPLGWMFFDLLFGLGGLNPAFYHATSWVLSAVNGVLLFQIVRRYCLLGNPADGWAETCTLITVMAMAAHPWSAESVGWNSGLLYLGGQFFASLAVLAVFARRQLLATGLYLMAQLVYPVFLSLPLVMLIFALSGEKGSFRFRLAHALRQYGLWLVVAVGTGALNWFAATNTETGFPHAGLAAYPILDRLRHFAALNNHYIGRLFWPGDTAPFYGTSANLELPAISLFITTAVVSAWLICAVRPSTRAAAWTGLALILASLLPFTGLFDQHQSASDRYAFLLLAVVGIGTAMRLAVVRRQAVRWLIGVAALGLIAALVPAHRRALSVWTDTDHLQARLDQVNASHPHVRVNYAKPAITAHLLGNPDQARKRLDAGRLLLGAHPEILAAEKFIRQLDQQFVSRAESQAGSIPYSMLHMDLANAHRIRGHQRAAEAHEIFARGLRDRYSSATSSP